MERRINKTIENNLINNSLWINKIKKDCEDQNVFLAIRDNVIDFYHKGGRLFCFDKYGFKTHIKYAAVITKNGKDYLTEAELKNITLATDFETNYSRIKENCSIYSGSEASGVSDIYHKHSYLSNSNVVVLDIEVSFASFNEENTQDRIDLLLYQKDTRLLRLVEVKHYSNKEIWSRTTPKVIGQIDRYESQIANRKSQILSSYDEYVKALNSLFNIDLPVPLDIDEKVMLLIFDFDDNQSGGRLKELIRDNKAYSGKRIYPIGNIKKIVMDNLWKAKIKTE